MKSALTRISNQYASLSYSEALFADYVLAHRDQIIHMAIAEVSEEIGIASSTIIAAVKKLGYTGFREFKLALASELLNPAGAWKHTPGPKEPEGTDTYRQVVLSNIAALKESLETMEYSLIQDAASLLLNARHICIFGVGTSGVLAREAHDFFFRLGLNSTFSEDLHYQLLAAARLKEGDVALLISQTGINKDIINIAEKIRQNWPPHVSGSPAGKGSGQAIIGISNYMDTPFAKYTDILLAPLTMLSTTHDNNFSFRIPILCIIETLYYTISEQMGEKYQSALKANRQVVEDSSVNHSV